MPKQVKKPVKKKEAKKTIKKEESSHTIEQLFGSKTRVRMLRLFLDNPERAYYVRELTRRIDAQLNSVRRELNNLIKIGVLKEVKGPIIKEEAKGKSKRASAKKKFYQADQELPFFEELRSIMKKSAILMNKDFVSEVSARGTIELLLLTGSFIDNNAVDSDMLIVGEIKPEDLLKAIQGFEAEIGREINYTSMPADEFKYRLEVKDRFLQSLLKTEKVVLVNELGMDV